MNFSQTFQSLAEAAALNGEACKSIHSVTLKATEQLYALNTDFLRDFMERCAGSNGGVDHQAQLQHIEQVSAYLREVSEIVAASQAEVFTLGSANAEALTRWLAAEVEKQYLPGASGQSAFSSALHSALSAASSSYERFVGTSRQLTEAGLGAVGKRAAGAVKKAA